MWSAHWWTIAPRLRHALRRRVPDPDAVWSATVPDARWGQVRISGRLRVLPGSRRLVVLVHGLGGAGSSHYMWPMRRAVLAAGASCLRLVLRGADGSGEDLYHAGLTSDLAAAMASPELTAFEELAVVGFSLGGHVALSYACRRPDPRLRAAATVCAPLDLGAAQRWFDAPGQALYRRYVLRSLKEAYRAVDRQRQLAVPLEVVLATRTIRDWDRLTVVPRFGFASPEDYYAQMSVGPHLDGLAVSTLLVASRADPMVPPAAVAPSLVGAGHRVRVCWSNSGGHVGFPESLDLGIAGSPLGLSGQVVGWLLSSQATGALNAPACG